MEAYAADPLRDLELTPGSQASMASAAPDIPPPAVDGFLSLLLTGNQDRSTATYAGYIWLCPKPHQRIVVLWKPWVYAFPRSSRHSPSASCTGRSENENIVVSSSASCSTRCQLGTTNTSFGPHSKVWPAIVLRPRPSSGT